MIIPKYRNITFSFSLTYQYIWYTHYCFYYILLTLYRWPSWCIDRHGGGIVEFANKSDQVGILKTQLPIRLAVRIADGADV